MEGKVLNNSCNRWKTNAPGLSDDFSVVVKVAKDHGETVKLVDFESEAQLFSEVENACKQGLWICCDACSVPDDVIRALLYRVWLRGDWDHHPNFRFWLLTQSASEDSKPLPSLLRASGVDLRYCSEFMLEFAARELVSAVEEGNLNRVHVESANVILLSDDDIVHLFHRAFNEEIFIAVFESPEGKPYAHCERIATARSKNGTSALDVAIHKDFIDGAVKLRNIGCRSECFDFEKLLDPSFEPMFKSLLDPWRPFPFDPVEAASRITRSGDVKLVRKLFDCRVDVEFHPQDYPLTEACMTGDENMVFALLDRMGATGANPFMDARVAAFFIREMLSQNLAVNEELPETAVQTLSKLADSVIADELRLPLGASHLRAARQYSELMKKLLVMIDVTQEENQDELLNFFIDFDPNNEVAKEVTLRGLEQVAEKGGKVDTNIFAYLRRIVCCGPKANQMLHWALELALFRGYLSLLYRVEGETLLMAAMEYPPNVTALKTLSAFPTEYQRTKILDQVDDQQNNALKRCLVNIVQRADEVESMLPVYGDALNFLITSGCDTSVHPPAFTVPLFTFCSRHDFGEICFELIETRLLQSSLIISCTPNLLSLMWRRASRSSQYTRIDPRLAQSTSKHTKTVMEIGFPLVTSILTFCTIQEVSAMMCVSTGFYYAALNDAVWTGRGLVNGTPTYLVSAWEMARREAKHL